MEFMVILSIIGVGSSVVALFKLAAACSSKIKPLNIRSVAEILSVAVLPGLWLLMTDIGKANDCCFDSAFTSPEHRPTFYVWLLASVAGFFYCQFRSAIAPPLVEVVVNCLLVVGIVLNFMVVLQLNEYLMAACWNLPIFLFFLTELVKNQRKYSEMAAEQAFEATNPATRLAIWVLELPALAKFPMLVLLCLPLVLLASLVLLLFGQRPDSLIRAFTETYHHGLSQWDYKCQNVDCGGTHFLCSVAAQGHRGLVRPERLGQRHGEWIVCNRQLLVANAFEEILQEKLPAAHRVLRRNYNRVGAMIHRHYHFFKNKLVADAVYLLMKPLELVFTAVIYCLDSRPEDRIALQYLPN